MKQECLLRRIREMNAFIKIMNENIELLKAARKQDKKTLMRYKRRIRQMDSQLCDVEDMAKEMLAENKEMRATIQQMQQDKINVRFSEN